MAKNSSGQVLLGFEDELVTENYKNQIDFTTNKIGGIPNYSANKLKPDNPRCPLCNLSKPLIVQIYAPIENSGYHRTLYLFGCVNSSCWGSNDCWTCIRVQVPDKSLKIQEKKVITPKTSSVDWCSEADDWGEDEPLQYEPNLDDVALENATESGGISEELEKMCIEEEISSEQELQPTAEFERSSSEEQNVVLDTQILPTVNLTTILHESHPLPQELSQNHLSIPEFESYFISVWNEENSNSQDDWHIQELLEKYEQQSEQNSTKSSHKSNSSVEVGEKYEKSVPAHGDKLFQKFLSKIKENPGQILRYSREGPPLLIHSLDEEPKKCQHCNGPTVFEFQLIPTIISKLKLISDKEKSVTRLDFGTVLVITCRNSCWSESDSFRTENVLLQMEKY